MALQLRAERPQSTHHHRSLTWHGSELTTRPVSATARRSNVTRLYLPSLSVTRWACRFQLIPAKPEGRKKTRTRQESFATREDAEARRDELNHQRRQHGGIVDRRAGELLFTEAAQAWLASRTDLKQRTRAEYENLLRPKTRARKTADGVSTANLSIVATFGGRAVQAITRAEIADWVQAQVAAGKKPSTVRHAFFVVKMVLAQAVTDGRIGSNPADYVKLPSERSTQGGTPGVVDDPDQFLTAAQVQALVAATPWPYNVYVHVAAWAGLRAAELCGLQVADVQLPLASLNPNAAPKPGLLRVDRTLATVGGAPTYDTPKTRGSRRRVPLTPATVALLRDYLALHPRGDDPTAPLFPGMTLVAAKPTGLSAVGPDGQRAAPTAAEALAAMTTEQAEARLTLDWGQPLRHPTFYKAVYRPSVLRAVREGTPVPLALKFHSLRHTYVSLCVAAGIPPLEIARFAGHSKVTTTLSVYAHLFEDDHSDAMSALGAMGLSTPVNVRRLHG